MIKIDKDRKVWITSDTHFGHKNICRGVTAWRLPDGGIPIAQTRDFESIGEMNDMIVNNINSVVGQDDVLIHLGDWSFGGFENIKIFRDRIVCKEIHLILGNHDHHIENNREDCQEMFTSVNHYTKLMYKFETLVFGYAMSKNGYNIDERPPHFVYRRFNNFAKADKTILPIDYISGGGWNGGCGSCESG